MTTGLPENGRITTRIAQPDNAFMLTLQQLTDQISALQEAAQMLCQNYTEANGDSRLAKSCFDCMHCVVGRRIPCMMGTIPMDSPHTANMCSGYAESDENKKQITRDPETYKKNHDRIRGI